MIYNKCNIVVENTKHIDVIAEFIAKHNDMGLEPCKDDDGNYKSWLGGNGHTFSFILLSNISKEKSFQNIYDFCKSNSLNLYLLSLGDNNDISLMPNFNIKKRKVERQLPSYLKVIK